MIDIPACKHDSCIERRAASATPPNTARAAIVRHRVVETSQHMRIAELATLLGHENFGTRLCEDRVLDLAGMPMQTFVEFGYFDIVESRDTGEQEVLISVEGQLWLARRYPVTQETRNRANAARPR